jgi:iron complex outermembrane receptor protein
VTGVQTCALPIYKYHRTQKRLNTTDGSPSSAPVPSETVYVRRDYFSKRDTTQFFVKDTMSFLDDALSITLGIKSLQVDYRLTGFRDFNDYYRTVSGRVVPGYGRQSGQKIYKDNFLPLAGILYKLDKRTQIFGSYAENMALPKGMDDIFSTTLASSSAFVPAPAPERSKNFELGVRTTQPQFYAALAGYYTRFQNRIQSFAQILPGTTNVTETFFTNVGRVKAYGLEFTGSYKPSFLNGLAYFNTNITYNRAKFQDNVIAPTTTFLLDGKTLPDSAKWVINGGVTVEPASWLVANVSAKYTSRRWSTFENTPGSSVPGFTIVNAYVDIGDGFALGPLKTVKARFNVDNLFDKDTLSFISAQTRGDGFFRPQSPRTFQFTITAAI